MADDLTTQAALAREIGVASNTVSRWTRRSDWTFGGAPWHRADLDAIREWASNLRENRNASGRTLTAEERAERVALVQARRKKIEIERKILAKEYIRRADVEKRMLGAIHAVKGGLLQLPRNLPARLQGASPEGWPGIIEAAVCELLTAFSAGVTFTEPKGG